MYILSFYTIDDSVLENDNPKRKPETVLFYCQVKFGVDVLDESAYVNGRVWSF